MTLPIAQLVTSLQKHTNKVQLHISSLQGKVLDTIDTLNLKDKIVVFTKLAESNTKNISNMVELSNNEKSLQKMLSGSRVPTNTDSSSKGVSQ